MSLAQPNQFPINVGLAPQQAQGARGVGPIVLQWLLTGSSSLLSPTITDDLVVEGQEGLIDNIQSLFFDNSANPAAVYLLLGQSQQLLVLPARSQGFLPVLLGNSVRYSAYTFAATIGLVQCSLTFFNTPCQPMIWSPPIPGDYQPRGLVTSVVNAGNTAIALNTPTPNTAAAGGLNRTCYIHGINITGTGATAESFVSATLSGIAAGAPNVAGSAYNIGIDVPIIGSGSVNVSRVFNPPLRQISVNAPGGFLPAGLVSLTVPAMGVGQTGAAAEIHWSFE